MVAAEPPGPDRLHQFSGVRNLGRVSERQLREWSLPVSVLFTGDLGRLTARDLRTKARVVAGMAAVFTGIADPSISRTVPVHLLLLPRRVLQGVLGRSTGMCGR